MSQSYTDRLGPETTSYIGRLTQLQLICICIPKTQAHLRVSLPYVCSNQKPQYFCCNQRRSDLMRSAAQSFLRVIVRRTSSAVRCHEILPDPESPQLYSKISCGSPRVSTSAIWESRVKLSRTGRCASPEIKPVNARRSLSKSIAPMPLIQGRDHPKLAHCSIYSGKYP